jgi:hypothetical protein
MASSAIESEAVHYAPPDIHSPPPDIERPVAERKSACMLWLLRPRCPTFAACRRPRRGHLPLARAARHRLSFSTSTCSHLEEKARQEVAPREEAARFPHDRFLRASPRQAWAPSGWLHNDQPLRDRFAESMLTRAVSAAAGRRRHSSAPALAPSAAQPRQRSSGLRRALCWRTRALRAR